MRTLLKAITLCAVASIISFPAPARAADDPKETLKAIDASLAQAGQLLRDNKPAEAAEALTTAKANHAQLVKDKDSLPADLRPQIDRLGERLQAAERLITKAQNPGAKSAPTSGTPPATKPDTAAPPPNPSAPKTATTPEKPATPQKPATPPKTTPPQKPAAPQKGTAKAGKGNRKKQPPPPSFTADVAPILTSKCGGCHVRATRGGLSMASFAALEKGVKGTPVIAPRNAGGSRLIEVIVSGDMPRGNGPKLGPEELDTIVRWINAGALFDGTDRTAAIGKSTSGDMPDVARVTGRETVLFNRDLAQTIVGQCIECHGGDQPAGQLRLESFADLMKGGTSGALVSSDKPNESLLLERLRGTDGDRMPKDKPPLPDELIARFATWIKEGARFDGNDPKQSLATTVQVLAAQQMSHEDLSEKRVEQARQMWKLALPDEQAVEQQTPNFLLIGNMSAARMTAISELAEAERAKVAKILKNDSTAPLVKGRLVIFVFRRSYDYSEFVRMVEQREAPRGGGGGGNGGQARHARNEGSDAYVCLAVPSEAEPELSAAVAEQITAGYLQSLLDVPPWFTTGAARAIAARAEPRSPLVKQWDVEVRPPSGTRIDAFLRSNYFDAESAATAYAFVRSLNQPRFNSLLHALGKGRGFDDAMNAVFKATPRQLFELWLRQRGTLSAAGGR